jgi:hypothetical protein
VVNFYCSQELGEEFVLVKQMLAILTETMQTLHYCSEFEHTLGHR